MRKNIIKLLSFFVCALVSLSCVGAVYQGKWADNPMNTLSDMMEDANVWRYKIQNTALNNVDDIADRAYPSEFKVSNTLTYIKDKIFPYMQWAVYIWLAAATIALIYMWFLLVTNTVTGAWDLSKLKSRIFYVMIGVLLLTGFYALIKLIVAVINIVLG
jgi:hypothetical protein